MAPAFGEMSYYTVDHEEYHHNQDGALIWALSLKKTTSFCIKQKICYLLEGNARSETN